MTTVTIEEDIHLAKTHFSTIWDFMQQVVEANFPDSAISNANITAKKMRESDLPEDFVNNFMRSYD